MSKPSKKETLLSIEVACNVFNNVSYLHRRFQSPTPQLPLSLFWHIYVQYALLVA